MCLSFNRINFDKALFSMNFIVRIIIVLVVLSPSFSRAQNERHLDDLLDKYYSVADSRKIYIKTDKYLYKTEENVWITGLVLDRRTYKRTTDAVTVYLSLEDNTGENQIWIDLVSRDGYVKGKIKLPEDFEEGRYSLKARFDRQKAAVFQKEILVKKHVIPFFIVKADLQHKYYASGDMVNVKVSAKGYDNTPLKSASFSATAFNGASAIYDVRGKLGKDGNAHIGFRLPDNLLNDGLKLNISIKEKQATESIVIDIPFQDHAVQVDFYPEGKNLVHGVINRMSFKATDKYGSDFPFEGKVVTMEGVEISSIKSDRLGAGVFSYKPHANQPLKVIITSPYIVKNEFHLPPVNTTGATLVLAGEQGDSLQFRAFRNLMKSSNFNLAVIHRGRKQYFTPLLLTEQRIFAIPKNILRSGVNQITLFDSLMVPLSELLYYFPASIPSPASVAINENIYRLRQRVDVGINATNPLQMSLSVVDEFRLRRDGADQNISSHLLLDSELNGELIVDATQLESGNTINQLLRYQLYVNSWEDIFKASGKSIVYNTFSGNEASSSEGSLYHRKFSEGLVEYTNFDYDNYYAAINPFLQEQLPESPKHEPPYKEQLRSGVEVKKALYTIKPYNVLANNSIVFYGSQTSLLYPDGALIVIDGVRCGTNINTLDNLSPYNVEEIKVSTKPVDIMNYTALNSVGVIEIITKRGEKEEEVAPDEQEFTAPVYSEEESRRAIREKSDFRTTLQWIPFREIGEFPGNIEIYHSDVYNKITGVAEGIDEHGNPFTRTFRYISR